MDTQEKTTGAFDVTIRDARYGAIVPKSTSSNPESEWHIYIHNENGASMMIGDKTVELSTDNYYLIPPGKEFSFTSNEPVNQLAITFETSVSYNYSKTPYVEGPLEASESFVAMIKRELSVKGGHIPSKGLALCTALCGILLAELPFDGKSFNPMIENAMQFLKERFSESVNIKELAESNGYCQDVFIRKFKKYTGLTPYNFLYTERISYTEKLLAEKGLPMDLIAEKAGFHDQAHFSRLFKRHKGVTPTKFRRKILKK